MLLRVLELQLDKLLLAKRLVLLISDKSARAAMSANGAKLVDGLGADRTTTAMEFDK